MLHPRLRRFLCTAAFITGSAVGTIVAAPEPADVARIWKGSINIPGSKLDVVVRITEEDGELTGTIDIPTQGAKDLDLRNLAITDEGKLTFVIDGAPGNATFLGELDDENTTFSGMFAQGGQVFPFSLEVATPVDDVAGALLGFDEWVNKALTDFEVPGLALGIVYQGELVYAKGYGLRDMENEKPVTEHTSFAIGSTTKAFTCFLLGMLVEEGLLEWDKPVRTYMPDFALEDEDIARHLTVRDLVTHRSGLPRHDLLWYNTSSTDREGMVRRLRHLPATKGLRETFQYNNLMYLVAGVLMERLTEMTYEDLLVERLLDPLGFEDATVTFGDMERGDDYAKSYHYEDDAPVFFEMKDMPAVAPAGCINASVTEMANWMKMFLAQGKLDDREFAKPATILDMQTPYMAISGAPSPQGVDTGPMSYGLGWMLDTYRGNRRVHHGGNIYGYSAQVILFPDKELGFVVLANAAGSPLPTLLVRHAADLILGLEYKNHAGDALDTITKAKAIGKEAEEKKDLARIADTTPSHPLETYAGDYDNPGYGVISVVLDGETLRADYNEMTLPLEHWHYETFRTTDESSEPFLEGTDITFVTGATGRVEELRVIMETQLPPFVFKKTAGALMEDEEYLEQLVGKYDFSGTPATIALRGKLLTLTVQGQPVYELEGVEKDVFKLKGLSGFTIEFHRNDDGEVNMLRSIQPNGVFDAPRK